MIEVIAKLLSGPVYLSGEVVECSITFIHPNLPSHRMSQSNTDSFGSLAWASAQIHCQCTTDSKISRSVPNNANTSGRNSIPNETSLAICTQDSSIIEFATKPKILFCDLRLSPGQTKTYIYREKIPNDSPPSYRGQLVKYSYKITIGMQRVNCPIKMLRVPLRILPIDIAALGDMGGAFCNETTDELTPANPFLDVRERDRADTQTPFDLALQALQNITARRVPNFYIISNIWGKVARFCLFKPAYKLGEDIVGTFDFTVATVNCMQVSVSLQCEEETMPFAAGGNDNSGTNLDGKNKQNLTRIVTYSKHHEVCLGLKYTQLILPIPLHVTPAFTTGLVSLKWRLHFEFVTSTSKDLKAPENLTGEWKAPVEVPIETMVWSLPIKLFSTTPQQVSHCLQNKDRKSVV